MYFRKWSATKKAAAKRFVDQRAAVIRLVQWIRLATLPWKFPDGMWYGVVRDEDKLSARILFRFGMSERIDTTKENAHQTPHSRGLGALQTFMGVWENSSYWGVFKQPTLSGRTWSNLLFQIGTHEEHKPWHWQQIPVLYKMETVNGSTHPRVLVS